MKYNTLNKVCFGNTDISNTKLNFLEYCAYKGRGHDTLYGQWLDLIYSSLCSLDPTEIFLFSLSLPYMHIAQGHITKLHAY